MSNYHRALRRGGGAADVSQHQATRSADGESIFFADRDSDESLYACSSSTGGGGDTSCSDDSSSRSSSVSSSNFYLHAEDQCCGARGGRYVVVNDYSARRLAAEHSFRLCTYLKAADNYNASTQTKWSNLLCGVSTVLAVCSLSSLASCIVVTYFSLACIEPWCSSMRAAAEESDEIGDRQQMTGWTERPLRTPPSDNGSPRRLNSAKQIESAARFSWDCIAQAGHTKCQPVRKVMSRRNEASGSSFHQHYRQQVHEAFHVLVDGLYHVSIQMAGVVWLPPPTLLRTVIARVASESKVTNVTAAHVISSSDSTLTTARRGQFSVYTAATMRLSAKDELLAKVLCVEEQGCVLHINGTISYLTLEKLD